MNPGEIYWTQLPTGQGHAQSGRRPAIVLQDDSAFCKRSPVVLAIPLTSNLSTIDRFPATFRIDPTPENGLLYPSSVLVFQTAAIDIDRRDFGDQIGTVDQATLLEIHHMLDQL